MNKANTQHIAIYGDDFSTRSLFFKKMIKGEGHPSFGFMHNKKIALFSNVALERFMEEELAHDTYDLTSTWGRSIRTLSSGEQKKALLKHLLAQAPDVLILDNPFDALDIKSVAALREQLLAIAENTSIVQLFKRRDDLLPFIERGLLVQQSKVIFEGNINEYLEVKEDDHFSFTSEIPAPLDPIILEDKELIRMDDINIAYQERPILKNINWEVNQGEFWQVKGPNGSGKSTLLTMIDGDNPKAYGQNIYLFGQRKGSGETVWDIKKNIGYFTPSMMELFKARRHKAEGMIIGGLLDSIGLYRTPTDAQRHLATQWLEVIGLGKKSNTAFVDLSIVEQRLILIARAMIKHPPVLILDEPSNGLDDHAAEVLISLINKIAKESSSAILYVSHRDEQGLKPEKILELTPTTEGSTSKIITLA